MKSYLLAFGRFPRPKSICILDRNEPNENFSEKRAHQKNYAFPAGIQGLNYEKVNFFIEPPQNGLYFRPSTKPFYAEVESFVLSL